MIQLTATIGEKSIEKSIPGIWELAKKPLMQGLQKKAKNEILAFLAGLGEGAPLLLSRLCANVDGEAADLLIAWAVNTYAEKWVPVLNGIFETNGYGIALRAIRAEETPLSLSVWADVDYRTFLRVVAPAVASSAPLLSPVLKMAGLIANDHMVANLINQNSAKIARALDDILYKKDVFLSLSTLTAQSASSCPCAQVATPPDAAAVQKLLLLLGRNAGGLV